MVIFVSLEYFTWVVKTSLSFDLFHLFFSLTHPYQLQIGIKVKVIKAGHRQHALNAEEHVARERDHPHIKITMSSGGIYNYSDNVWINMSHFDIMIQSIFLTLEDKYMLILFIKINLRDDCIPSHV